MSRYPGLLVSIKQSFKWFILISLGSIPLGICVTSLEPGIRVGDMGHEHHSQFRRQIHSRQTLGRIERQQTRIAGLDSIIDSPRSRPEFDNTTSKIMECPYTLQETLSMGMKTILLGKIGNGDEADSFSENGLDGLDLIEWGHAVGERDTVRISGSLVAPHGIVSGQMRVDVNDRAWRGMIAGLGEVIQFQQVGCMKSVIGHDSMMIGKSGHPDIVLVHDWLVTVRGAERVLDRFASRYGPTDLYTLVHDGSPLTDAIDACRIHVSPMQRLPGASGSLRRWYLPIIPRMIESLAIRECDLVLSDSSSVAKSVKVPEGVPHLCYCHSPARYIWDQTEDYAVGSRGYLRAAGLRTIRGRFQKWDRKTAKGVDCFLANSHHIADRIRRCWDRESTVVYPPVRTNYFTPDADVDRQDWFLVVGALEPYKRTDLAIKAAVDGGHAIKVVGGGSQLESLRRESLPGVEFLGRVSDEDLRDLYRSTRALLFPQEEDFGIVAVEAQACGCPVIALGRGGALETITSESGLFVDEQSSEAFAHAMGESSRWHVQDTDCRLNAERFSCDVFDEAMDEQIGKSLGIHDRQT
tara:strand:+ start:79834 stop:81573 length:1740 start_codon:yes stop_codon:yes gene_type:complete